MDTITLSVEVGQDHRLVIQLPDDVPPGLVDITIKPSVSSEQLGSAREIARSKLLAAGKLNENYALPEGFTRPSDEELQKLVVVVPGTPSIDEIIDEDRGPH